MKILLAASEIAGFAKTGGLADVMAALPRRLVERGHECALIMPLYHAARAGKQPLEPTSVWFHLPVGTERVEGRLWRSRLPRSQVPVYLVEQPKYYELDLPGSGYGLYQYSSPGGHKRDYSENCARFVFFARAILEAVRHLDFKPDLLHLNDWQTGLTPVYLAEEYHRLTAYAKLRSVMTIHNLAYQGLFWHWDFPLTGLDWRLFNFRQLEFYGHLNFLKAGLVFADALTTVSPTYAREIQTPYYGCGLQGLLLERRDRLTGIVNGVDYDEWNPALDPHLAATYTANTLAVGKTQCKEALQKRLHLPRAGRTPILAVVARMVEQKGVDLILGAAERLLRRDVQLIALGEGHPSYQDSFLELARRHPQQVSVTLGFDEILAHQIEAGADMFLMPSQYEPSGLNQLYSLKYGTVPVVRATGGLADTVVDADVLNRAAGKATGFSFHAYNAEGLIEAISRALTLYEGDPQGWLQLQRTGMSQDWSWNRSAAEYEKVYEETLRFPLTRAPIE